MFKGSETVSLSDNNPALMPRQKYLGEKALHLRIVEEFLSQMEFSLLKTSGEQFDFEAVRTAIAELKGLADDENPDRRKRVEFQLAHELLRWQEHLAARDEKIEAYHIRRYCDGLKKPLDANVFIAMARFYRDLPRGRNSLSKFDLALTRAFSTSVSDLYRSMSVSRDEVAVRLASLYCSWDRVVSVDPGSPRDVAGFDKFIAESDAMDDFQSLTQGRLFDRIRDYKAELGDRFWDPGVAAAAVECNIVVGNHLNGLMARASETLGERLGTEFDFAGSFQDTSPNTGAHISEALRQIDKQAPLVTTSSESDDLGFLRSLMELTDTLSSPDEGTEATEVSDVAHDSLSVDQPDFRKMLALLDQHNPDTSLLVAYITGSDLGGGFDLDSFLFGEDQLPDDFGREALRVILSLESFRQHELHERSFLSPSIKNSVLKLLANAEDLGESIERSLADEPSAAGRRLRIANKLLECRLRAERTVFKFTSRGLGILPEVKKAAEDDESPKPFLQPDLGRFSANRWIIGATVAIMVISMILYFAAGDSGTWAAEDVEIFEASRLPGGKDLTGAHREGSTLFVIAGDKWRSKSDEQKTEHLMDLMGTKAKKKIETVLVLNATGERIADVSDNNVNLGEIVDPETPASN